MVLVFLNGEPAGVASAELEAAARIARPGPIEAFGVFRGAMTTWFLPQPGMREAGVTKLVTLERFERAK